MHYKSEQKWKRSWWRSCIKKTDNNQPFIVNLCVCFLWLNGSTHIKQNHYWRCGYLDFSNKTFNWQTDSNFRISLGSKLWHAITMSWSFCFILHISSTSSLLGIFCWDLISSFHTWVYASVCECVVYEYCISRGRFNSCSSVENSTWFERMLTC